MKKLKRNLSLLLAGVICLTMVSFSFVAFGESYIGINDDNFKDAGFREIIAENYDLDGDGRLSENERKTTYMSVSGMLNMSDTVTTIESLDGISFFPNIEILRCGGIGLTELDVSGLYNLKSLTCHGNHLTSLSLITNYALEFLNCSDNDITELILPMSSQLKTLYCYANSISSLDLKKVPNVVDLRCDQNELTALDLSGCTHLELINCSSNHIPSLDLSKTAITEATDYEIGDQNIDVVAKYEDGLVIVPFADKGVNLYTNYRGCSLDLYEDGSGFEGDQFVANEVDQIKDGIVYECYPMLDSAENMSVKINVIRDFYQVNFYTSSSMTDRIGFSIVNSGEDAIAPEVTQAPQCKVFDSWSEDCTNVTADINTYIVWADNHRYSVKLAWDKDTVLVNCDVDGAGYEVSFISLANSKLGDDKYDANVDVIKDGCINAKDYAVLLGTMD